MLLRGGTTRLNSRRQPLPVEPQYDVIIVGGGPSGMAAGLYAARMNLKTVLLERGPLGGQLLNTELIEDLLQGAVSWLLWVAATQPSRKATSLPVTRQESTSSTGGTGSGRSPSCRPARRPMPGSS